MSGAIPIVLTVAPAAVIRGTSVLRSIVHRQRERADGIGGTQDFDLWGTLLAWAFLIVGMVTGVIWVSQHSRSNHRSACTPNAGLAGTKFIRKGKLGFL